MLRDFLVALAILGAGVLFYVLVRPRKTLAGDMDAPMDLDRARARSEAAMAAPITEADEQAAAPLVAYVEEIGTDEFPDLAFEVDPLTAPIPDGYRVEGETFFNNLAADRLSAFTWTAAVRETVALSSVQVVEPPVFELESFTASWTAADVARMVAEAKAANAR